MVLTVSSVYLWLLHSFSPNFSLSVNVAGFFVLLAKVILWITPPSFDPTSGYGHFRREVGYVANALGHLVSVT